MKKMIDAVAPADYNVTKVLPCSRKLAFPSCGRKREAEKGGGAFA